MATKRELQKIFRSAQQALMYAVGQHSRAETPEDVASALAAVRRTSVALQAAEDDVRLATVYNVWPPADCVPAAV